LSAALQEDRSEWRCWLSSRMVSFGICNVSVSSYI
jgi:hypothetical protein